VRGRSRSRFCRDHRGSNLQKEQGNCRKVERVARPRSYLPGPPRSSTGTPRGRPAPTRDKPRPRRCSRTGPHTAGQYFVRSSRTLSTGRNPLGVRVLSAPRPRPRQQRPSALAQHTLLRLLESLVRSSKRYPWLLECQPQRPSCGGRVRASASARARARARHQLDTIFNKNGTAATIATAATTVAARRVQKLVYDPHSPILGPGPYELLRGAAVHTSASCSSTRDILSPAFWRSSERSPLRRILTLRPMGRRVGGSVGI
jgi:hypothetical protein